MKIKKYYSFISESNSIEIDGYILHEDDIEEIFSELYSDVPQLEYSQVSMKDITNNSHPSIRSGSNNIPYAKSQFEVKFFLPDSVTKGTDWWGRFYQPFPKKKGEIRRHFRTGEILPEEDKLYKPLNSKEILESIDKKMFNRIGYNLTKMSMGGGNGYWLFFYFSKND